LLVLTILVGGLRMAAPLSQGMIIAVGILLLIVAAVLLLLSQRPTSKLVSGVALANVTSAFVIAFWLIAAWDAFSTSGHVMVIATIAGLILLALAELLATMSPTTAGD
jgi:hypothetical protein